MNRSVEEVGREVASGSLFLSAGDFVANCVAAVGSIFIARLLGPSDYGLVSVALIFPIMLAGLTDLGISEALIRFTASERRERYITIGLFFKLAVGASSALLMYFFAAPIASCVLLRPHLEPLLRILSVYVLSNVVLGAVTPALIGLGRYGNRAILLVVQNALRVSVTLILILFGLGVQGAVLGFSATYAISAGLGIIMLRRGSGLSFAQAKITDLKTMISYSLPLYAPVLLSLPLGQYYNLLLAWFVTNEEIGNYNIAMNLLTPLALVGGSISTAIFSAFSKSLSRDKANTALNKTILYSAIIIAPISLTLIVFSQPITQTVYGGGYALAPQYLSLLAMGGLYSVLGSYVLGSYFKSAGATRRNLQVSLISAAVTAPLAFPLVMHLGIVGSIASSLAGSLVATVYALHIVKTRDSMDVKVLQAARAAAPSLAAAGTSALAMFFVGDLWAKTAIGIIAYSLTLVLTIPVAIDMRDIRGLRVLTSDLKFVGKVWEKALSMELKLAELIQGG